MLFGISFVQWVFILIGVAIVVVPYLGTLRSWFNKPVVNRDAQVNTNNTDEGRTLTDIVRKWESLETACRKAELTDACIKLNEVFPLLIKTSVPKINV